MAIEYDRKTDPEVSHKATKRKNSDGKISKGQEQEITEDKMQRPIRQENTSNLFRPKE